jgi:hypothetical protein
MDKCNLEEKEVIISNLFREIELNTYTLNNYIINKELILKNNIKTLYNIQKLDNEIENLNNNLNFLKNNLKSILN